MPSSPRLEQIQEMLREEPDDPFLLYGLAMEHVGLGADEMAVAAFRDLLYRHPSYVAAYLMLGQSLQRLDRTHDAAETLRQGIATAKSAGNEHAMGEMQALLAIVE